MPTTLEAARVYADLVGRSMLSDEEREQLAALEAHAATQPQPVQASGGTMTLAEIEAFRVQMEARGRAYDRAAGLPETDTLPAATPAEAAPGQEPDEEGDENEEAGEATPGEPAVTSGEPSGPAAWLAASERGAVDAWIVAKYRTKAAWDRAVRAHHKKLSPGHTLDQADVILAGLEEGELAAARRGVRLAAAGSPT